MIQTTVICVVDNNSQQTKKATSEDVAFFYDLFSDN